MKVTILGLFVLFVFLFARDLVEVGRVEPEGFESVLAHRLVGNLGQD